MVDMRVGQYQKVDRRRIEGKGLVILRFLPGGSLKLAAIQ